MNHPPSEETAGTRFVPAPSTRPLVKMDGDDLRVIWRERVLVHDEDRSIPLRGVELGRRTLVARGSWRVPGTHSVTLELVLYGQHIFVVAFVDRSEVSGAVPETRFRFSVTSPEGNDLLARYVREFLHDADDATGVPAAVLEPAIDLRDSRRINIDSAA